MIKSQTSSSVDHTTSIPVGNTSEASSKIVTMSAFEKGMQKSMTESCTIPHLYLQE